MPILTRYQLIQQFQNGMIPSQSNFENLIDSMLNKCDDDFFGRWKESVEYYVGDVVIYGNTLYRLVADPDKVIVDTNSEGTQAQVKDNKTAEGGSEEKLGDPYCSTDPPNMDTKRWAKLTFDLKDEDWEYDNDTLTTNNLNANTGIGTKAPQGKLHVDQEQRGRLVFNPIVPYEHHEALPQTSPEIRLERDLVEDCDPGYLSVRQDEDATQIETSANHGYFIHHKSDTADKPALVMSIRPEGTGIGSHVPDAALHVNNEGIGEVLVNPTSCDSVTIELRNKDGHSASESVDEDFNTFTTNAKQGFKFRPESDPEPKKGYKKIVVIDERGFVGLGTDSPQCVLDAVNPECGRALVSLDNTNPAFSIVNLRPAGKTSYLTSGAENTYAVFKTDAECGFVFKRGAKYDPSQKAQPEKDLNGDHQVYIDQDGKVGIGKSPNNFELDVHGTLEAHEMYLPTNEKLIEEIDEHPIENAIDKICSLNPIRFKWRQPDDVLSKRDQFGLRASECDDIVPEVVKGEKGNLAIAYQNLVPLLIKAIQEQQEIIKELRNKA